MSENEQVLYTPKQVAEKIGVAPNMVGIYFNEFKEFLEEHTVLTKEVNGHRRYTEEGLSVFFEIKRQLDLPNATYQKVRDTLRNRRETNLGGLPNVLHYEELKMLEKVLGADGQIVRQMYAMAESYKELVKRQEIQTQLIEQQNLEIQTLHAELLQSVEDIRYQLNRDWATITMKSLEAQGKPSLFVRFVRGKDDKLNELRQYCKEILDRDRKEIAVNNLKIISSPSNNTGDGPE